MKRRTILFGAGTWMTGLPLMSLAQSGALQQVAMVIGNDNYRDVEQLVNASRDARLMHETFTKLGVRSELRLNLKAAELTRAMSDFVRTMQTTPVDIAWFFFSGHGAALDGKSLLLGTDVSMETKTELRASGYDLDRLKGLINQVKPRIAIVIVDACRNNPFNTRSLEKASKGMVPKAWDGTLVAYSTAEYTRALDWSKKPNGPYASALSEQLLSPKSRDLEAIFKAASDNVFIKTEHTQTPGYYSELRAQVWFDAGKVSVRALPGSETAVAGKNSNQPRVTRSLTPARYRADLQLDDQYAGVSSAEWAQQTSRLEFGAPKMDRYEVADLLVQVRKKSATDRDLVLAGLLLEAGNRQQGVEKNRGLAAQYYERAAKRGFVPAQTLLGELAYERQDYVQSYKWLSVAAESGYGRPILDLAQLTGEGLGTERDMKKAAELFIESFKALPGMEMLQQRNRP
jgi:uncharacterized caspase-like protein